MEEDRDNLYLEDLAKRYEIFLLDIDGVIWSGGDILEGAFEGLQYLQEKGNQIYFISNNSTKSQNIYIQKFKDAGCPIHLDPSSFYVSAYTVSVYLEKEHPEIKKVYIIGMRGLRIELERVGIEVIGGENDANISEDIGGIGDNMDIEGIQGVIIGADHNLNYYKILYATLCVRNGALLIGTNPDIYYILGANRFPGNYSMIRPIEAAAKVKALILGKPHPIVVDTLILNEGFDPSTCKNKMIIVGDNLNTDIKLGNNTGIDTLCVYTGCTTPEYLENIREEHKNGVKDHSDILPTYALPRFAYFRGKI